MAETLVPEDKKPPLAKSSRAPRDRAQIDRDGKILHRILLRVNPQGDTPAVSTMWLPALIDGDEKWIRQLACDASRRPYEYTGRKDFYRKASVIWSMPAGEQLLIEKGYISAPRESRGDPLMHRVQDSHNFASIEIGVRKYPELELVNWEGILAHPKTPIATKRNPKPFEMILASGKKVVPDGRLFALRHRTAGMIGFFKETDRGTEDTGGKAHVTYEKKIEAWKKVFEERLYDRLYGFPRAMLLFITNSEHKEKVIQDVIRRVFKGPCPFILTQWTEDFDQSLHSVQPHSKLIDEPWHRVGYPDFDLKTFSPLN